MIYAGDVELNLCSGHSSQAADPKTISDNSVSGRDMKNFANCDDQTSPSTTNGLQMSNCVHSRCIYFECTRGKY